MLRRVLKIGRWVIDVVFAPDGYDVDAVLAIMYDCGADRASMRQAERLMRSCGEDCGFTYPNPELFRAVVVIGPTSSSAEFLDTLAHEIHHMAVAIASELGVDLEGERPAYLVGDTVRELADVVCELGCPHCR